MPLIAYNTCQVEGILNKMHFFFIFFSKKAFFTKKHAHISHTVLADGDLLLAIEKFVRDKQIDVIALSTYRRNILARMFNPSIARKMLFHTDTPLLVIDSKK